MWLLLTNGFVGLIGLLATVWAWRSLRRVPFMPLMSPVAVWLTHATIYLNTITVARLCCGYAGPSTFATSWAIGVYLHAFLSTLMVLWMCHRNYR
ncbi:MAG: hypothetical protein KDE20_13775 [Caldilineaceae bacterium]|nr:hypothetical protein [Caldilineaceae bacterium]